ncbi:hypothetical protein [Polyangium sp. y55x31]|uniref:hypothetical protein n=1 Tax=Polyangium sp. y55x31 TaxID=3042688 RepID=UPI002482D3FA|nr:hypothetical protein [Polyangium sp. y55x31]MDI1480320.1 hypothetical protein [Polyangium sp. y55x31]
MVALAIVSVGLSGCPWASDDALLARAPSDLSCPKENLTRRVTTDSLGHGKTVVVEGCGRRQTYVSVCNGSDIGSTCTWLRDGAMTNVSDAPAAGGSAQPAASPSPPPSGTNSTPPGG